MQIAWLLSLVGWARFLCPRGKMAVIYRFSIAKPDFMPVPATVGVVLSFEKWKRFET